MWILIASSLVPMPLVQGWVMFVSVFCFLATTSLMVMYIIGTHGGETSWITLVSAAQGICVWGGEWCWNRITASSPEDNFSNPELRLPWKHFQYNPKLSWPGLGSDSP